MELEVIDPSKRSGFHLYNISFPSYREAETIIDLVCRWSREKKLLKIQTYYYLSTILHVLYGLQCHHLTWESGWSSPWAPSTWEKGISVPHWSEGKKANTFLVMLWHTYTAFLHVPLTRKNGRFWNYMDLHLNIFYFWERHQSPILVPFLCKLLYANPDSVLSLSFMSSWCSSM